MDVYHNHAETLERLETQMGRERGRLALAQDLLTDALSLIGQHGVYCQSARQPGRPALDLQITLRTLNEAKELVTVVMDELKGRRS